MNTQELTYQEKIKKVKAGFPDMTDSQAHEQVMFLDWITRENDFLKEIYPQFKKDINPDESFMGMCVALWCDESTGIKNENMFQVQ